MSPSPYEPMLFYFLSTAVVALCGVASGQRVVDPTATKTINCFVFPPLLSGECVAQVQTGREKIDGKAQERQRGGEGCGVVEHEEARRLRNDSRPPRGGREGPERGGHGQVQGGMPKDRPGEKEEARILLALHRDPRITGSEEIRGGGGGGKEEEGAGGREQQGRRSETEESGDRFCCCC